MGQREDGDGKGTGTARGWGWVQGGDGDSEGTGTPPARWRGAAAPAAAAAPGSAGSPWRPRSPPKAAPAAPGGTRLGRGHHQRGPGPPTPPRAPAPRPPARSPSSSRSPAVLRRQLSSQRRGPPSPVARGQSEAPQPPAQPPRGGAEPLAHLPAADDAPGPAQPLPPVPSAPPRRLPLLHPPPPPPPPRCPRLPSCPGLAPPGRSLHPVGTSGVWVPVLGQHPLGAARAPPHAPPRTGPGPWLFLRRFLCSSLRSATSPSASSFSTTRARDRRAVRCFMMFPRMSAGRGGGGSGRGLWGAAPLQPAPAPLTVRALELLEEPRQLLLLLRRPQHEAGAFPGVGEHGSGSLPRGGRQPPRCVWGVSLTHLSRGKSLALVARPSRTSCFTTCRRVRPGAGRWARMAATTSPPAGAGGCRDRAPLGGPHCPPAWGPPLPSTSLYFQ